MTILMNGCVRLSTCCCCLILISTAACQTSKKQVKKTAKVEEVEEVEEDEEFKESCTTSVGNCDEISARQKAQAEVNKEVEEYMGKYSQLVSDLSAHLSEPSALPRFNIQSSTQYHPDETNAKGPHQVKVRVMIDVDEAKVRLPTYDALVETLKALKNLGEGEMKDETRRRLFNPSTSIRFEAGTEKISTKMPRVIALQHLTDIQGDRFGIGSVVANDSVFASSIVHEFRFPIPNAISVNGNVDQGFMLSPVPAGTGSVRPKPFMVAGEEFCEELRVEIRTYRSGDIVPKKYIVRKKEGSVK
jgi:hypothetical protein